MTDNRLVQELRGALCELLGAFKAHTPIPPEGTKEERQCLKAVKRAEFMLCETRKRKEGKRKAAVA